MKKHLSYCLIIGLAIASLSGAAFSALAANTTSAP